MEDLSIVLTSAESPALNKIRKMRRLCELVYESKVLFSIFLQPKLIDFEAVPAALDLLRLLTRIFKKFNVA
jgi:hypothetical protein